MTVTRTSQIPDELPNHFGIKQSYRSQTSEAETLKLSIEYRDYIQQASKH